MGNVICGWDIGNFNLHCFQDSFKFKSRKVGLLRFVIKNPFNREFFDTCLFTTCVCNRSNFLAEAFKVS